MPSAAAVEGQQYIYQIAATSSDGSAITFSLMTGPVGATLSGNTISWTPTHAESRTSNAFTVVATTSAGGSAPQSWTVTPNGTVNITAVDTFWTQSGPVNITQHFLPNEPFPAALIPQPDGSFQRIVATTNPDGSLSIPNIPPGTYLLQLGPNANYFTSTSDFDAGTDLLGQPLSTTSQNTTIFTSSISGLNPPSALGDLFLAKTDLEDGFSPAAGIVPIGSSTFTFRTQVTSNIDLSKITTLYLGQYQFTTAGNFTGYVLGPSQTLSNVTITNGTNNPITGTLSTGAATSLSLSIAGSAWAALSSTAGPGGATPLSSDYAAFAQAFLTDRLADFTTPSLIGPDLTLIRPAASLPPNIAPFPHPDECRGLILETGNLAAITTDVNYGSLSYQDSYPSSLPRLFQYCQVSSVALPRPNSNNVVDTFFITDKQTTTLPTAAVTPILSNVQSPMLNGASLFAATTLNTTKLNLSWTAPATGTPFGYFVEVFQLTTLANGTTGYLVAGVYATSNTSMTIPFISANATYVFEILADSDANAAVETHPFRHQVPSAESIIISSPIVIAPGATATTATAP